MPKEINALLRKASSDIVKCGKLSSIHSASFTDVRCNLQGIFPGKCLINGQRNQCSIEKCIFWHC